MDGKDQGEKLLEEGLKAVDAGNFSAAKTKLDEAGSHGIARTPQFDTAYAVCLAALKQQFDQAISMCRWAIELEPCESGHYLQLGRIYLLADNRQQAISTFREGMLYRRDRMIIKELDRLGVRRRPVFDDLPRTHLLNRVVGKILCRVR